VDFASVLSGSDQQAKEAKKAQLMQERDLVNGELEELTRINADAAPEATPVTTQPPAAAGR
jgi:hypothetical protein